MNVRATQEQLDTSLADLEAWGMSLRISNLLDKHRQALFVGDLVGVTEAEIVAIPNVHEAGLKAIRWALKRFLDGESPDRSPRELAYGNHRSDSL